MRHSRTSKFGRLLRRGIIAALLCGTMGGIAAGEEIKFIANATLPASSVTAEELKRVFLLKANSLWDGHPVVPVIGLGGPAYRTFLTQYADKTDAALRVYYRSLVFTGKALMPKILPSDEAVIDYVTRTKNAIGFVSATARTDGLRTITVQRD